MAGLFGNSWERPILQTDPPFYISAESRAEYARYVGMIPAWARFIDRAADALDRLIARGADPVKIRDVQTKLGQLRERYGQVNDGAKAAYAAAVEARAIPPQYMQGMGDGFSVADGALAVTEVAALVIIAFFAAALSPWVVACLAVIALISAVSLALTAAGETIGDISRDLGPTATAGLGLGLLAVVGLGVWMYFGKSKPRRGRA